MLAANLIQQCDIFSTYFVKNKLEVIRRLTSWLVFCRDYEGSTSQREGGYFIMVYIEVPLDWLDFLIFQIFDWVV
jgi:hypothetical protein